MNIATKETGVIAPDSDILTDLLSSVEEQREADGGTCLTPHGSANERAASLTQRWIGTRIVARVADSSPVDIIKSGLYQEPDEHNCREYVRFEEAQGKVKSMSPSHGGYIELDNEMNICLPTLANEVQLIPAHKLGLDIETCPSNN